MSNLQSLFNRAQSKSSRKQKAKDLQRKTARGWLSLEHLEDKICLTASVGIDDGNLLISGDADGPIEISLNEAQMLQVSDDGVVLGAFEDVFNIDIELDATDGGTHNDGEVGEAADDVVILDVGSYELNEVNVGLGEGTNSFTFVSGEVENALIYWGLHSSGSDTVIFEAASTVEGDVILELGDGDDIVELHGEIDGNTEAHGDGGDDTATVGVTGDLDGSLLLAMGGGTNSFTSHGEIGEVNYFGSADEDVITLSATSEVKTDARLSVDGGDNVIAVLGTVNGNLTIVSANDEEAITIDENAVAGTTTIDLGVIDDHGHDHEHAIGDINQDGDVDQIDLGLLLNNFGDDSGLGPDGGNLNDDIYVNSTDLGLLLNNFGDDDGHDHAIDITDAILTNRSGDCGDYVGTYTAEALDIQNQLLFNSMITITADATSCTVTSDSVPNHEFNDESAAFAGGAEGATITATETISVVARNPEFADEITPITTGLRNAIFLNGVRLDIVTAGCYQPNSPVAGDDGNTGIGCTSDDPWLLDALGSEHQFGVDEHNGHTQPGGLYHYHGSPNALFENEPTETGSGVIGFAADGFPVFGSFFLDAETGEVREAISGYTLLEGSRGERSNTNPGGDYDGEYVDDWAFTDAGDLDQCNGMVIDGQYGYYMTNSFPWGVHCLVGTPDDSFLLGGGGGGGGPVGPGGPDGPGGPGGPGGAALVVEVGEDKAVSNIIGDTNLDGIVDSKDLGVLLHSFGDQTGLGWDGGNLNGDDVVDTIDLDLLIANYGASHSETSVAEDDNHEANVDSLAGNASAIDYYFAADNVYGEDDDEA